jgi:hypothetical protein
MICLGNTTPGNGGLTAEIGENKFFAIQSLNITRSRVPGQSSASFELELPSSASLQPSAPNLVCITNSAGKSIFNGLYLDKNVQFLDVGAKRKYSITVTDFFSFTTRNIIANYIYTDIFSSHITRAVATANTGGGTLKKFDLALIGLNNDDFEMVDGQEDPFTVPYDFQFEGFLNDFLDQQCALANCSWELKSDHWNRISNLVSGGIAIIQIRRNGSELNFAPKNPFYAPYTTTTQICLNGDNMYENVQLNVKGTNLTKVTVLGKNGKYSQDPLLDNLSLQEVNRKTIPPSPDPESVILGYEYNPNATKVIQVQIITPND